ncbi:pyridoxal phosphate-dependent aminotransferase [Paramicrobacterium agarici]|uniref:Aromatic amino acid aminotransferase n=1 Tax=Paramicrobacterium agarici TaxID=630514 RepID=A0A2A9DV46_9MICO|nr:pyridoxal phosphate-dependent aminotransferase [Microbacterium agarici]PFG30221.1 histidinol-phosphate aminotransferase [Microbacterium agarici]
MNAPEVSRRLPDATHVRLRPEILATPPYRQGKPAAADAFKLSSNENPFPPLPGVIDAIVAASDVNRYPDAAATALRQRLAAEHGVDENEIHVGAGSVALLSQFIQAAAGPGDEVLYSWRSFEAYPGLVTVAGATSVQVPNTPDGEHDLDAMAAAITDRTRVLIVCTPNNPTGTTVSADDFDAFMARVPESVLVLLDEAYVEFVRDDAAVNGLDVVGRYANLVILRTFSKAYGLAGLRVGWAIGPVRLLDAARASAIPLSVTGTAQAAAIASLDSADELLERVEQLVVRREHVVSALRAQGWSVPDTQANFVWLPTGDQTDAAAAALAEHGIVSRPFAGSGIRISIGEPESVDKLLAATDGIVKTLPSGHGARTIG